ncbi:MAG: hypothetical protein HYU36_01575 [Planctomycetes bacterium]|nr:hypothetical protein [Planctomycetota bacterium]
MRYILGIDWETVVWCAQEPDHLIHLGDTEIFPPRGGTKLG